MPPASTLPVPAWIELARRFALVFHRMCHVVALRGGRDHSKIPLVVGLVCRLRRRIARLEALVALARQGTPIPPPRPRPARSPRPPTVPEAAPQSVSVSPAATRPLGLMTLPRQFGWAIRQLPETAIFHSELQAWLSHPDIPALLAAEPRLRRILRPLCHMLLLRPDPTLFGPPRAPRPTRKKSAASRRKSRLKRVKIAQRQARAASPHAAGTAGFWDDYDTSRWRPKLKPG